MNIRDRAKDVAQAAHEIKSLELSQRIANLHSDIVALVEENLRLNDENKELKETLRLKREMKYKEPFYFLDGDETPFCPACWESKSQLVHLSCLGEGPLTLRWTCPSCKHLYLVRKVRPVVPASRSYGGRAVLKVEWDRRKTA